MSKVIIGIIVEDGKIRSEFKNESASGVDIALSITALQIFEKTQLTQFEKLNKVIIKK